MDDYEPTEAEERRAERTDRERYLSPQEKRRLKLKRRLNKLNNRLYQMGVGGRFRDHHMDTLSGILSGEFDEHLEDKAGFEFFKGRAPRNITYVHEEHSTPDNTKLHSHDDIDIYQHAFAPVRDISLLAGTAVGLPLFLVPTIIASVGVAAVRLGKMVYHDNYGGNERDRVPEMPGDDQAFRIEAVKAILKYENPYLYDQAFPKENPPQFTEINSLLKYLKQQYVERFIMPKFSDDATKAHLHNILNNTNKYKRKEALYDFLRRIKPKLTAPEKSGEYFTINYNEHVLRQCFPNLSERSILRTKASNAITEFYLIVAIAQSQQPEDHAVFVPLIPYAGV